MIVNFFVEIELFCSIMDFRARYNWQGQPWNLKKLAKLGENELVVEKEIVESIGLNPWSGFWIALGPFWWNSG
jgi:hypothetical protein